MAASTMPVMLPRWEVSGWRTRTPSMEAEAVSHAHVASAFRVAPSELRATMKTDSGSVRFNRLKIIVLSLSCDWRASRPALLGDDALADPHQHAILPALVHPDGPHPQDLRHAGILILRTHEGGRDEVGLGIGHPLEALAVQEEDRRERDGADAVHHVGVGLHVWDDLIPQERGTTELDGIGPAEHVNDALIRDDVPFLVLEAVPVLLPRGLVSEQTVGWTPHATRAVVIHGVHVLLVPGEGRRGAVGRSVAPERVGAPVDVADGDGTAGGGIDQGRKWQGAECPAVQPSDPGREPSQVSSGPGGDLPTHQAVV